MPIRLAAPYSKHPPPSQISLGLAEAESDPWLLQVRGPSKDLHSGNDGGVFNEPLSDLTKLLASVVDSRNSVQVGNCSGAAAWHQMRLSMHAGGHLFLTLSCDVVLRKCT